MKLACVAQFIPVMWFVSWVFWPRAGWTWQILPAVCSMIVLYALSGAMAYKGIKAITRGYNGNTRNNRKRQHPRTR